MSGPATVGWCPGALRPMASGDGLILRVKPRGGRLTLDQAGAIARLSRRFGNGHLDLTGRANLQIRGARPDTLEPLTAGLREAGLLDRDAATEGLRNIVAGPLAGCDQEGFDTRPFLAELERCLATEPRMQVLPPKWSFVVDGGGRLPLAGVAADMRFRFDRSGRLRVGLDGAWAEPGEDAPDLPGLLTRVAVIVAEQPHPVRMPVLLARLGSPAVFTRLGLQPQEPSFEDHPKPDNAALFAPLDTVVTVAPPFGDLPAETLGAIAELCGAAGGWDLRLTPWRVMLATGIADACRLRAQLARHDLILDAADPRLNVSACVGAPACHRAATPTRADAALLASRLGRDLAATMHVAGCAKGCARPPAAPWTLVGRDGVYDLFSEGEAGPRVTGLSSTEAANWLSRAGRVRMS